VEGANVEEHPEGNLTAQIEGRGQSLPDSSTFPMMMRKGLMPNWLEKRPSHKNRMGVCRVAAEGKGKAIRWGRWLYS